MEALEAYHDKALAKDLVNQIHKSSKSKIVLMEVCGGHTMAIQKFGIPSLLPKNIKLLSGPGCPVCVSSRKFIDQAIAYSRLPGVIITTFGDLIRVPGSTSSLEKESANGNRIKTVYSSLDALQIARQNPDKKVIFLGIGFETTAPTSAATIIKAQALGLTNFFLLSSHKIMPPVMTALIEEGVKIDGYIGPGHVSTITGTGIYESIPAKFGLGVVVSGFEPVDILESILLLIQQKENHQPKVENAYVRAVHTYGNKKALKMMYEVFECRDDWWRGLGVIPKSGLKIKNKYAAYDAEQNFTATIEPTLEENGCICGEILKGMKNPKHCRLFDKECTPANPVGACMVSNEGACHAYYRYTREN